MPVKKEAHQGYSEDLAHVHDSTAQHGVSLAPGVLEILTEAGITGGLIVDLGCGSGHLAKILCQQGFDVLGIDYSTALIQKARARVPGARFEIGSYIDVDLPGCDAIVALGEIFNYQLDTRCERSGLQVFFQRAYHVLKPGGLLIFDVSEPGRYPAPQKIWFQGDDWFCMAELEENAMKQTITRKMVILRRQGDMYRRTDETHYLKIYPREAMVKMLKNSGFEVQVGDGYGACTFNPRFQSYAGYVARKPGENTPDTTPFHDDPALLDRA